MSIFEELKKGIVCKTAEDTIRLAENISRQIPEDQVIALDGNLGAGKTTFTKGIGRALGLDENSITSPTFNLYTIHQGTRQLIHIDGYRLEAGNGSDGLLIEEFLSSPWLIVVEWPERGLAEWMLPYTWKLNFKRQREDNSLVVKLIDVPQS